MPRTGNSASSGVQTNVGVEVDVGTHTRTLNFATTESIMFLMDYVDHRGLGVGKLTDIREELEDAIWICLSSRTLTSIIIEVYDNESGELVERFDLNYAVRSPEEMSDEERRQMENPEEEFESYHEEITEALSEYDAPPAGCSYRVLLAVDGDVPDLGPDWGTATLKETEGLERNDLGDAIDLPNIDAAAELWV
jgi:hypothetical protein